MPTNLTPSPVNPSDSLDTCSPIVIEQKIKQHLPNLYQKLKKKKVDWAKVFAGSNKHSSDQELFAVVKEGNLNEFEARNVRIETLNKADKYGITLLDWMLIMNHQHLLNYLFSQIKKRFEEEKPIYLGSFNLLHWAIVLNQSEETIKELISQFPQDTRTYKGLTPLGLAAQYGRDNIAKILLMDEKNKKYTEGDGEAFVNIRNSFTEKALLNSSLFYDYLNHVQLHNPDLTPLHYAVYMGHTKIVELLLDQGADVNACCLNRNPGKSNHVIIPGDTALHLAVRRGDTEMAKLLLARGAEANKINDLEETPLFIVVKKNNIAQCKLLLQKTDDLTLGVLKNSKVVTSEPFIETGDTILHVAIRNGSTEIISHILSETRRRGCFTDCLNAANKKGETPKSLVTKLLDDNKQNQQIKNLFREVPKDFAQSPRSLSKKSKPEIAMQAEASDHVDANANHPQTTPKASNLNRFGHFLRKNRSSLVTGGLAAVLGTLVVVGLLTNPVVFFFGVLLSPLIVLSSMLNTKTSPVTSGTNQNNLVVPASSTTNLYEQLGVRPGMKLVQVNTINAQQTNTLQDDSRLSQVAEQVANVANNDEYPVLEENQMNQRWGI